MDSKLARIVTKILLALRRHAQRRSDIYAAIAQVSPFFAGPVLIIVTPSGPEFLFALKRYLAVLILFGTWELLLSTAIRLRLSQEEGQHTAEEQARAQLQRRSKSKQSNHSPQTVTTRRWDWRLTTSDKLRIAASTIVIVLTLDLFRGYFNDIVFALVLASFTCGAYARFLQRPNPLTTSRYLRSLAPQLMYGTGLGYLTCLAMRGDFFRAPLVLSSAIAAMAMTPALLRHIISEDAKGGTAAPERTYLVRSLALLIAFAPVAVALLVYTGQLAMPYLAVLLCFVTGNPLLHRLSRTGLQSPAAADLQWLGSLTAFLFLVVLAALRAIDVTA